MIPVAKQPADGEDDDDDEGGGERVSKKEDAQRPGEGVNGR